VRFNRVLWLGLKGEEEPYPVQRSGRNLRVNRQRVLANAARKKGVLVARNGIEVRAIRDEIQRAATRREDEL
jgi:hypothetical protein